MYKAIASATGLICVITSAHLAINGIGGSKWAWFLFAGILAIAAVCSINDTFFNDDDDDDDDDDEDEYEKHIGI